MQELLMSTKQIKQNISINKKVFVGLSGGVDSAVSAALLKDQGFDVTGVFIKVWSPEFLPCTWKDERRDAMRVAAKLNIPFIFFDFEKEYKKEVADYMINEYIDGRIPNPDVLCNREIKFGAFWRKAKELGADYIATGHYARNINQKLFEGVDKEKDQSYFLWTLTKDDLEHVIFPIGDLDKAYVRKLARKYEIPVSNKKDSQGICFLGEVSLEDFLPHFTNIQPGNVLNKSGQIIGTHKGAIYYTKGERHGFDIEIKSPTSNAYYVVSKDMKKNTVTVANSDVEVLNFSPRLIELKNINFSVNKEIKNLCARIRYRGEKISIKMDSNTVDLLSPTRGVNEGQSIVFYDGEHCIGGAIINRIIS